jgi:hypothetical protein
VIVSSTRQRPLFSALEAGKPFQVVIIDNLEEPWKASQEHCTPSDVRPNNALYAVFTSVSNRSTIYFLLVWGSSPQDMPISPFQKHDLKVDTNFV